MPRSVRWLALVVSLVAGRATPSSAQAGGFIARLGADTVHVERFLREPGRASGTIVTRTPSVRVLRWSLTYDERGHPVRYQADAVDAQGKPVLNGVSGVLRFLQDSMIRDGFQQGLPVTTRMAAPPGVVPSPSIPYIGVSYLMYEDAFAAARARGVSGPDSIPMLYQVTMIPAQARPSRARAWFIGADSAELDYFGRARSGYRFDADGRLLRANWEATTYRYRIDRVGTPDVDAVAKVWSAAEASGKGFGALSPRDSVIAQVESSQITIDYSRPARRGRVVWGDVVPTNIVWRLGADMATHFTTSADILVGDTRVPAGRYTLWMLRSGENAALIVSSAVNVFGTGYNPARDFARIPMQRTTIAPAVERLTLAVRNGTLRIEWADVAWVVPLRVVR